MKYFYFFYFIVVGIVFFFFGSIIIVFVQEVLEVSEIDVEKIDVLGKKVDYYFIMLNGENCSVFGLDKLLYEIFCLIIEISEDLVDKFVLCSVDDLVCLILGVFISLFFGIKGVMDICGEFVDNYFWGFCCIVNLGVFNIIVCGVEKFEVMCGLVLLFYGSGSVGGQFNYIFKLVKVGGSKYIDEVIGDILVIVGLYN